MMSYTPLGTIFLIFFLFLQHTCADLVTDVCKQTRINDLCKKTLYNSSEYSDNIDAKGLARIMIEAAQTRATDNLFYVKKLMNNQSSDDPNQCIQVCYKDYNLVVKAFIPNALQSLSTGSKFDAAVAILLSADQILSCQDENCLKISSDLNDKCNEYADFAQLVADVLRIA